MNMNIAMNKERTGAYVAHECKKCGCAFVAEDYTNAQDRMPKWRYCEECAKKLGIEYKKQRPWTNRTPEQNQAINERMAKLKIIGAEKLKEWHKTKSKIINFAI